MSNSVLISSIDKIYLFEEYDIIQGSEIFYDEEEYDLIIVERIEEKVKRWASQMKQINRICDKCGIEFKTHYSKEEAPKIYCKNCYKKEVY